METSASRVIFLKRIFIRPSFTSKAAHVKGGKRYVIQCQQLCYHLICAVAWASVSGRDMRLMRISRVVGVAKGIGWYVSARQFTFQEK